jgi:mannosyl-oligosaccharide alpha-1,3-glucosidase
VTRTAAAFCARTFIRHRADDGASPLGVLCSVWVHATVPLVRSFYRGGHIVVRLARPRRSTKAQRGDPYTLVVALDSHQAASGHLYLDDGATFDFLVGEYTSADIKFQGGVLSYVPTHAGLQFSNTFESVVIMGYAHVAPDATYTAEYVELRVKLDVARGDAGAGSYDHRTLAVRNPQTPVSKAWSLKIWEV